MSLSLFHPLIARWFAQRFKEPTAPQAAGWIHIAEGRDTLIAAPTGSGKTLAAFLWSINTLIHSAAEGDDATAVVYVSPLRALGNDIQTNLQVPLAEMRALAHSDRGVRLHDAGACRREVEAFPDIRIAVRSGDTPARERVLMTRRPPQILITTPESLYILLTAERSREFLRTTKTVILDEIHAIAGDKRGAHLALSLERLDQLTGRRCQRIGLSATQKPVEEIARLLVGCPDVDGACPPLSTYPRQRGTGGELEVPDCAIVDIGHRRPWELSIEVPQQPLGPIATHEMWEEVYDRIAAHARSHRATLVFVHTRRLVERLAHHLTLRLGEGKVAAHHGSLARHIRLDAEQRLKSGQIPVVVATASLELGIDIGHVDLVCHIGAPRALASLLQRVGRSGHWMGSTPKGILFPLTRDDLLQCAAAVRAVRAGELDRVVIPEKPLDVLAQQIVATVATGEIAEETLWKLVRRAYPYRALDRGEFDAVVAMLSDGVARRLGRTTAHLHRDRVHGVLRPRRGARLAAITSGGAIPDNADYDVVEDPQGVVVGKVNEDFAIESMAGDIFLLGNTSWRIRRVESGRVRVENAHGAPPSVPFWLGEAPSRTPELSGAVSVLREDIAGRLSARNDAIAWLTAQTGVDQAGAVQMLDYIAETVAALGCVPSQRTIVAERFFDESGGMQLVLHTPFGGRINRAWGLALRKRFCVTFDFELQAAATDDGIVLSLGQQHSFPLESVFAFLRPATVEADLLQAVLASPLFTTRWRWNVTRALALLRHTGGRRVPMPIQRMRAEDLLAAAFPEQVACQDNRMGPIVPPEHPLVTETIRNCLNEAMDLGGLQEIIAALERREIRTVAVDTPVPSPISHEILNANPYAFLDDAPLEERRARAVSLRRTDPELARTAGALDEEAIAEVRAQAWPDVRTADDLHDLLLTLGVLPTDEARLWAPLADELVAQGRATVALWSDAGGQTRRAYVAAERVPGIRALGAIRLEREVAVPGQFGDEGAPARDEAARDIVHGWLQCAGPVTAAGLAQRTGLGRPDVEVALAALENAGVILRGHFTPGTPDVEWCERRLLSRIHRLTLGRLRREVEAVSQAEFMRFLLRWQHVHPGTQVHGRAGLLEIIGQLQGLEVPAPAWEEHIFPARVRLYDPADLDALCLDGTVTWGRLFPGGDSPDASNGNIQAWRAVAPQDGHAAAEQGSRAAAEQGGRAAAPQGRRAVAPQGGRRQKPGRNVPIAFVLRDDLPLFLDHASPDEWLRSGEEPGLSSATVDVARFLKERGASFFTEIARGARRLPYEVEAALWELVSLGLVSGDGVAGLRRLVRKAPRIRRRSPGHGILGVSGERRSPPTGRWALWGVHAVPKSGDDRDIARARQLLRRYGVVFRDILARERSAPAWRTLLEIYRRWEAQGEIRGGRFVSGFVGEQFALPEAVEALRAVRRASGDNEDVVVSAADPLNLVGIVVPGSRVSSLSGLAIAFHNGAPAAVAPHGALLARLRRAAVPAG